MTQVTKVNVRRYFFDNDYGQIHVRLSEAVASTQPAKRPLLCLHMSPKSGRIFARFMAAAGVDRRVIAPDYPGYGESDPPPVSPAVTITDYAQSIWELLDQLDITTVDILGYHTGSLVAAEMARLRGFSVERMVMIGAPVFLSAELDAAKTYFAPIPLDAEGTRFHTLWQKVQQYAAPGNTFEMMAESFAENLRGGENYEWGHHAAFEYAPNFPNVVRQLSQRIDVINPNDDLRKATWRISDYLQLGFIHDRPQWGHGFLDFDTQNAADDIRQLLDRPNLST